MSLLVEQQRKNSGIDTPEIKSIKVTQAPISDLGISAEALPNEPLQPSINPSQATPSDVSVQPWAQDNTGKFKPESEFPNASVSAGFGEIDNKPTAQLDPAAIIGAPSSPAPIQLQTLPELPSLFIDTRKQGAGYNFSSDILSTTLPTVYTSQPNVGSASNVGNQLWSKNATDIAIQQANQLAIANQQAQANQEALGKLANVPRVDRPWQDTVTGFVKDVLFGTEEAQKKADQGNFNPINPGIWNNTFGRQGAGLGGGIKWLLNTAQNTLLGGIAETNKLAANTLQKLGVDKKTAESFARNGVLTFLPDKVGALELSRLKPSNILGFNFDSANKQGNLAVRGLLGDEVSDINDPKQSTETNTGRVFYSPRRQVGQKATDDPLGFALQMGAWVLDPSDIVVNTFKVGASKLFGRAASNVPSKPVEQLAPEVPQQYTNIPRLPSGNTNQQVEELAKRAEAAREAMIQRNRVLITPAPVNPRTPSGAIIATGTELKPAPALMPAKNTPIPSERAITLSEKGGALVSPQQTGIAAKAPGFENFREPWFGTETNIITPPPKPPTQTEGILKQAPGFENFREQPRSTPSVAQSRGILSQDPGYENFRESIFNTPKLETEQSSGIQRQIAGFENFREQVPPPREVNQAEEIANQSPGFENFREPAGGAIVKVEPEITVVDAEIVSEAPKAYPPVATPTKVITIDVEGRTVQKLLPPALDPSVVPPRNLQDFLPKSSPAHTVLDIGIGTPSVEPILDIGELSIRTYPEMIEAITQTEPKLLTSYTGSTWDELKQHFTNGNWKRDLLGKLPGDDLDFSQFNVVGKTLEPILDDTGDFLDKLSYEDLSQMFYRDEISEREFYTYVNKYLNAEEKATPDELIEYSDENSYYARLNNNTTPETAAPTPVASTGDTVESLTEETNNIVERFQNGELTPEQFDAELAKLEDRLAALNNGEPPATPAVIEVELPKNVLKDIENSTDAIATADKFIRLTTRGVLSDAQFNYALSLLEAKVVPKSAQAVESVVPKANNVLTQLDELFTATENYIPIESIRALLPSVDRDTLNKRIYQLMREDKVEVSRASDGGADDGLDYLIMSDAKDGAIDRKGFGVSATAYKPSELFGDLVTQAPSKAEAPVTPTSSTPKPELTAATSNAQDYSDLIDSSVVNSLENFNFLDETEALAQYGLTSADGLSLGGRYTDAVEALKNKNQEEIHRILLSRQSITGYLPDPFTNYDKITGFDVRDKVQRLYRALVDNADLGKLADDYKKYLGSMVSMSPESISKSGYDGILYGLEKAGVVWDGKRWVKGELPKIATVETSVNKLPENIQKLIDNNPDAITVLEQLKSIGYLDEPTYQLAKTELAKKIPVPTELPSAPKSTTLPDNIPGITEDDIYSISERVLGLTFDERLSNEAQVGVRITGALDAVKNGSKSKLLDELNSESAIDHALLPVKELSRELGVEVQPLVQYAAKKLIDKLAEVAPDDLFKVRVKDRLMRVAPERISNPADLYTLEKLGYTWNGTKWAKETASTPKNTITYKGNVLEVKPHPLAKGDLIKLPLSELKSKAIDLVQPDGTNAIGNRLTSGDEYLRTAKEVYAPEVTQKLDGSLVVTDGRHRLALLEQAGITDIPVVLRKETPVSSPATPTKAPRVPRTPKPKPTPSLDDLSHAAQELAAQKLTIEAPLQQLSDLFDETVDFGRRTSQRAEARSTNADEVLSVLENGGRPGLHSSVDNTPAGLLARSGDYDGLQKLANRTGEPIQKLIQQVVDESNRVLTTPARVNRAATPQFATAVPDKPLYHGSAISDWQPNYNLSISGSRGELGSGLYLTTNKKAAAEYAKARMGENVNPATLDLDIDKPGVYEVAHNLQTPLDAKAKIPSNSNFFQVLMNTLPPELAAQVKRTFGKKKTQTYSGFLNAVETSIVKAGLDPTEDLLQDIQQGFSKQLLSWGYDSVFDGKSGFLAVLDNASLNVKAKEALKKLPNETEAALARYNADAYAAKFFPERPTTDANLRDSAYKVLEQLRQNVDDKLAEVQQELIKRVGTGEAEGILAKVPKPATAPRPTTVSELMSEISKTASDLCGL